MKFLLTRAKGSTKALAERLGVSRRTVERYRAGMLTTPQKRLQAALTEETESEWQPQVRAQAREQASNSGGMMVHVVAYFEFTASGSSDDGRIRHITTPISATYAQQILQFQASGATEEELHPVVAQAVTESYFTEWGTRAVGGFHPRPVDRFRVLTPQFQGCYNRFQLSRSTIGVTEAGLLSPRPTAEAEQGTK
ncbi:telomere-protecting terminal protein Tpg [Streptomyces bacillaris]|uniref:telomere-protecting terminal protein Tpg n=1 Tax=Streptomyces bacillaris TaxID=68179 RepID=UPI003F4E21B3